MINFINKNLEIQNLYISTNVLNEIIDDVKEEILINKENILKLYEIDKKNSIQIVNIKNIIELLELYKNKKIENKEKEIIMASYNSNPCITINLCMQSLIKKRGTLIVIDDNLIGVNKFIVTIFNNVLEKFHIVKMVEIYNKKTVEEIKEINELVNYIVCIGNTNIYYKYYKEKVKNLRYLPFKNVALYCDDNEFDGLKFELYKYAIKNGIEIEIYNDEIDEYIECVNSCNELENALIFSKSEYILERCKKEIGMEKLHINENIFKNEHFVVNI